MLTQCAAQCLQCTAQGITAQRTALCTAQRAIAAKWIARARRCDSLHAVKYSARGIRHHALLLAPFREHLLPVADGTARRPRGTSLSEAHSVEVGEAGE